LLRFTFDGLALTREDKVMFLEPTVGDTIFVKILRFFKSQMKDDRLFTSPRTVRCRMRSIPSLNFAAVASATSERPRPFSFL
jgi:hypothetical protein